MTINNTLKYSIICIILISFIGLTNAAPPGLPMGLYGDVNIGADPAPKDTKIEGKVGNTIVATTYVVNSGKYGDNGNYLGITAPKDGDNVDLFVNGVYAMTVKYTPEQSTRIDLSTPETSTPETSPPGSSSSGESTGGSSAGGEGSGRIIKPTTTPLQSATMPAGSTPEVVNDVIEAEENKEAATGPIFNLYTVLSVFVIIGVVLIILKKSGKI